jgi:histone chaperone ASF1
MAPLVDDLEWKLTYVGSAESESFDQELDSCMVGPVPLGVNSFEFEVSKLVFTLG